MNGVTARDGARETKASAGSTTKMMVVAAAFAAMITVMTAYICHIPVGGNGGYVHFGDSLIYLAAVLLPQPYAALAAGIGGGLADLLTAPAWAPATIIIKVLLTIPFTCRKDTIINVRNLIAPAAALVISAVGYWIAEGILFGSMVGFIASISGSLVQGIGSAVIFIVLGVFLDKLKFKKRFMEL